MKVGSKHHDHTAVDSRNREPHHRIGFCFLLNFRTLKTRTNAGMVKATRWINKNRNTGGKIRCVSNSPEE